MGTRNKRKLKNRIFFRTYCKVADEPVVVLKFQPVKPGNSVEDKTETIMMVCHEAGILTKSMLAAKGGSK